MQIFCVAHKRVRGYLQATCERSGREGAPRERVQRAVRGLRPGGE
jgi:hypothetical protein